MKKLFTALLMLTAIIGRAQVSQPKVEPPVVFIDSTRITNGVNYLNSIDPNSISSLNVVKNNTYPNGVLYVTLKDHSILSNLLKEKVLSLNDLRKANVSPADMHKPILYIIDDKLLTDTTGIRYAASYVKKVRIVKAKDTLTLKQLCRMLY